MSHFQALASSLSATIGFGNITGVVLLSGKVRRRLDDYWRRYKAGELEPTAKETKGARR
ncbi:MAG: alanine:cation symporter family protein [Planctomycetia bacterium]|nr:alanine:cation symporter family protein [Planctomycetia bacterium]